jgi:hypothetical protein
MRTKIHSHWWYVLVFHFLLINTLGIAQTQNVDVIKIINGPEIEGRLIEIKNDTVFFMAVGDVLVKYPLDKVEVIKKLPVQVDPAFEYTFKPIPEGRDLTRKNPPDSGYFISISVGLSFRALNPGIAIGYRLNSALQPHVKLSYAKYAESPGTFILTYAGIKGNFKKTWSSPYYLIRGGYGFNLTSEEEWTTGDLKEKKGGAGLEFGLGVNWSVRNGNYIWNIALTQNIQRAQFIYDSNIWTWPTSTTVRITEDHTYLRTMLRIGFEF